MRRALASCLVALFLAAAPAAAAVEPLPMQEVAPGVFVHQAPYALAARANDGAVANVGFVVGGEAVAVIDTGGSRMAGARLREAVRARTALPIRYVINTHMHPDHVLGNVAFAQDGARFVGHHKLPRALAARAQAYLEAGRRQIGDAFAGTEPVPPDLLVETELDLDLGSRKLVLQARRTAHTDNDLTVLDQQTGTWFLGDLLFMRHVPAIDGSLLGWLALMRELRDTKVARIVPGHGPASAPWPDALAPQERYLARLEGDLRDMLQQGRTISEAAAQAGLSERDAWALFDEFNARNAITGFHELEWE